MKTTLRPRTSGAAVLLGALMAALALAGCGTAPSSSAAGTGGTTAAATTPSASAPATGDAATAATAAASTPATPAGGPVPRGFAATSVTFVSTQEAFVLGTAPCSHAPCTSIVRTLDRGGSWRGLPAPVVPLGQPASTSGPAVWGIRFATPSHGFVFGNGLWETTDGGEHWAQAAAPAGSILSLEVIDGQVLAVTTRCSAQNGCGSTGSLERRSLSGGAWQQVIQVPNAGAATDAIATQARVAAVLDGTTVVVTGDGGLSTVSHSVPCTTKGVAVAESVAVTGPDSLALLCAGEAAMGSVDKTVYVSSDLGQTWTQAGAPPRGGDPIGLAGATPNQLVVTAASGASFLYYSGDAATQWGTAYDNGDGGAGFNDLGFTTTSDGVVVHGPARSDGNSDGDPGQLLLTSNGGATWQAVSF
jgi:hypothetical protein